MRCPRITIRGRIEIERVVGDADPYGRGTGDAAGDRKGRPYGRGEKEKTTIGKGVGDAV